MMSIDLREFLKWAYHEQDALRAVEQRDAYGSGRYAEAVMYGTTIDKSRGVPVPDVADLPVDAVTAVDALMTLPLGIIDLPEIALFPDLYDEHGLIADAVDEALTRRAMRDAATQHANAVAMLISNLVRGKQPVWEVEQPTTRMVMRAGKPAWFIRRQQIDAFGRAYDYEADGYDRRAGRPLPGAYRKFELAEPFGGHVQDRIDWMLWARMLTVIAEKLSTGLKSHRIKPFHIDVAPWGTLAFLGDGAQGLERIAV